MPSYTQNIDEMDLKLKTDFLKSHNKCVNLKFNSGLELEVYYSFTDDTIYMLNDGMLDYEKFYDFISFSNFLNAKYSFELNFKNNYSDFQKFKTIYLRHNLCLNKPFISAIVNSSQDYLEKFNLLFGVRISPKEEIKKDILFKLNETLNGIMKYEPNKISNFEIPILIFIGEYYIQKYGSKWKFKYASNDFGNEFLIPFVEVNGKDLELSRRIYRYLNHPKFKGGDEKISFEYFLDMDFIITQSLIKPKKQG